METENKSEVVVNKNDNQVLLGVLCYLGILVVVSYIMGKDEPFVKFHIKQGLVLLFIELVSITLLPMVLFMLWPLIHIINFGTLILSIIGMVNVINKKQVPLPLVGSFADYFTF